MNSTRETPTKLHRSTTPALPKAKNVQQTPIAGLLLYSPWILMVAVVFCLP